MKIIDAKVEIIDKLDRLEMLKKIELIGRTCYKSEDKITDDSCKQFVKLSCRGDRLNEDL